MRQLVFVQILCSVFLSFMLFPAFAHTSFEEYGKAAYYSDALHGRKTASGAKYDKNAFTCAHKTLPYGTKLRVTRLDNQLAVIVTVNDRGPYKAGFIVDLSRAAATEINLIKAGVADVKIEVIATSTEEIRDPEPVRYSTETGPNGSTRLLIPQTSKARSVDYSPTDPRPATIASINENKPGVAHTPRQASAGSSELFKIQMKKAGKTGFGIQVGTLNDAQNVLPEVAKLEKIWPGKVLVRVQKDADGNPSSYRLILGPYPDRKSAEAQQKQVARKSYPKCFITALNEA